MKQLRLSRFALIIFAFTIALVVYWVVDTRCSSVQPLVSPTPLAPTHAGNTNTPPTLPSAPTTTELTASTSAPANPILTKLMSTVTEADLEFYECALDRFRYDGPPEEIIPVGVVPLTIERSLFRTFLCNLTVSFKHLVVIVNGFADDVNDDIKALEILLPKDHFHVYRRPEITSFSGCVNIGFEFALSLPFDEAPYLTVFNSDTRYSAGFLNRFARHVRETVLPDKPLFEQLTKEVEDEVAAAKRDNRTTLRTLGLKGLSQSVALPDRLRYGDPQVMRDLFAKHTGVFTHVTRTMCSFAVSRLVVATAGLYDENFFPAYGEDYDWVARVDLMGFNHWEPGEKNIFGSFQHILNGMLGTVGVVKDRTPASFYLGLSLRNMIDTWMIYKYTEVKWGGTAGALYAKPYLTVKYTSPFNSTGIAIPLDVWVFDEPYMNSVKAVGFRYTSKESILRYNISLLLPLNMSQYAP
ncbi:galactofuranosyltransferase [Strigomonas culicis]|uniref:Galactofuranosyltransferase n=1 Tax=Strigomonas culicis TaxID=28005 RepID=S9VUR2_9TRYP|nr:galactofuranosyltransferase [Strigomonas culicis]|eukprot:EPY27005.1 galactofuranosyltransferase [Strigomonas culicis]